MPKEKPLHRKTLFDYDTDPNSNLFCKREDLSNEASVESFFVNRLIKDLGYKDSQIKTKQSVSEFIVALGSKKVHYKPDYVLTYNGTPRLVIDAKATDVALEEWEPQCRGYCLELNKQHEGRNPVELFVLSNGLSTKLYKWDEDEAKLALSFSDFKVGNPRYEQLRALLAASTWHDTTKHRAIELHNFNFEKPSPEVAKRIFANCHQIIWKSEGVGPTEAFMMFTKLMFVKLWADRALRNDPQIAKSLDEHERCKIPKTAVSFSRYWIEAEEKTSKNPINNLFRNLRDEIESDIALHKKKRIFEKDEEIDMSPDTIKAVVDHLEHYDMFGIDEDLNGRLFETFLSATMRGKGLGQYFTPRSIVKLMVRMGDLKITETQQDKVLDACCGTGGFLIEALADMRNKVRENKSLTDSKKQRCIDYISNETIYGIDFGKKPPIARIARINMYLHGDGGSRIYYADSLDKELKRTEGEPGEVLQNREELKTVLNNGGFNVVLTNPPFSMTKQLSNESEARILRQYDLAKLDEEDETSRSRASLRSSAMFFERYRDLLNVGGRLFTVIDDTVMASGDFSFVRKFIRKNFIVRGIVSLPGDAFQRSESRSKTSILCLEKKEEANDEQPNVFYAFSEYLGVDELPPKASAAKVQEARSRAYAEIEKISSDYLKFLDGDPNIDCVAPERIKDRFDLKFVVPLQGRLVPNWMSKGIEVEEFGEVVDLVEDIISPKTHPEQNFVLISVTYDGICQISEIRKGKHIKPSEMLKVHTGNLVFSKIRAIDGSVGIVPPELDGSLVSNGYVVMRCKTEADTVYLWSVLRSHEIRADLMSDSTGTGRYTVDWEDAKHVQIPWLVQAERERIARGFLESWNLQKEASTLQNTSLDSVVKLGVESEYSKWRFNVSKPPR